MANSLNRTSLQLARSSIWLFSALLLGCSGDAKDLGNTKQDVNTLRDNQPSPSESNNTGNAADTPTPSMATKAEPKAGAEPKEAAEPKPAAKTDAEDPPIGESDTEASDAHLQCSEDLDAAWQWRDALLPGVPDGPLVGIWQGQAQVSDLGLPSGSRKVTLVLAEDHASITFGETPDESPLLNQTASASTDIREGFEYTLLASEVLLDETDPDGDPFAQAVRLSVFPFEPYDDLCQEQEPSAPSGDRCQYNCMPSELSGYETTSEQDGECFVDGTPLSCDRVALCASACTCDEGGCSADPLEAFEMVAGLQPELPGWFLLSLPPAWTALNNAPTIGANGQVWVQLLHAEPPSLDAGGPAPAP